MSLLLDQFRRSIDPFLLGYSDADLLGMGMLVTGGLAVPFFAGGVVLRRRRLYGPLPLRTTRLSPHGCPGRFLPSIPGTSAGPLADRQESLGPWTLCGCGKLGDAYVMNFAGFEHQPSQAYQYSSATMLGNGFISEWSEPQRLDFDDTGKLINPGLPNAPSALIVEAIAGGKFVLVWEYDSYGQGASPTDFQVFEGPDELSVNFGAPLVDSVTGLNTVRVVGRRRRYGLTTSAFSAGSAHVFVVRARNAAGIAERNTFVTATKTAQATAAAITSVISARLGRR